MWAMVSVLGRESNIGEAEMQSSFSSIAHHTTWKQVEKLSPRQITHPRRVRLDMAKMSVLGRK